MEPDSVRHLPQPAEPPASGTGQAAARPGAHGTAGSGPGAADREPRAERRAARWPGPHRSAAFSRARPPYPRHRRRHLRPPRTGAVRHPRRRRPVARARRCPPRASPTSATRSWKGTRAATPGSCSTRAGSASPPTDAARWTPEARIPARLPWIAVRTDLAGYRGVTGPGHARPPLRARTRRPRPRAPSPPRCVPGASTRRRISICPCTPGSGTR